VRRPGEVQLVVNEVTPESRAALLDRVVTMVIATPLPVLCAELMRLAAEAVQAGPSDISGQHFLRPELVLPESV
jgi:LacI family transcriptional regulator